MTDVKVLLEELREESETGKLAQVVETRSSRRRWLLFAGAAVVAMIAAAGVWFSRSGASLPRPRLVPLTTTAGSEDSPSFSPDGNQVAFAWNGENEDNWDIYVKIIGSATALRLTTDAAADRSPAWSRDGRQIAFVKMGAPRGIYLVSPLGGPEQKILDFDAEAGSLSWSPDGKFLVVAKSYRQESPGTGDGSLFLIPVQGGEPRPILVPKTGHWYLCPAFAPSNRMLAFASCGGATTNESCDLSVVDLGVDWLPQGRTRQPATGILSFQGLAWTADGRSLVYSGGPSHHFSLAVVNVAGGDPRHLETGEQGAFQPAVALNGNRLAFSRSMGNYDIWRLHAGEKPQPFLVSSLTDQNAQFSADGRRIAFASNRNVEGIAIWLANADGTGLVQLTRGPESYHGSPRWSPDGRLVAFDAQNTQGQWNIKVVDSGGGQSRQLTGGAFTNVVPGWSRDGKWIYFGSDRSGRFEIWRAPAQGGEAGQVTRDGGYVALESVDAKMLYYTKSSYSGPLYARPLAGGAETQILEYVAFRGFQVFEDGIYYIARDRPRNHEIRFYDFATGKSRSIGALEARVNLGLSVSPDRKTFLFTASATSGNDLMLIENFR
jgi:Tol biopolymer transport system component